MAKVKRKIDPSNPPRFSQEELARIDSLDEEDIDYSDIPPLDDAFFQAAEMVRPSPKQQVTIRFDKDVLDWFKAGGRGYQSRINAVLRAYVRSRKTRA